MGNEYLTRIDNKDDLVDINITYLDGMLAEELCNYTHGI